MSAKILLRVAGAAALTACAAPRPGAQPAARERPAAPSSCEPSRLTLPPRPAPTVDVRLPAVPPLPSTPAKTGDAYTVWGASYALRSRARAPEVLGRQIAVGGYIVKTNLMEAPRCAVHAVGVADPPECKAPLPAFWLGDTPDAAPEDSIKVLGWASNFAQIHDAIREFDAGGEEAAYNDSFWGVSIPNPLPAVGAEVIVEGTYDRRFTMASSGTELDSSMGILTYQSLQVLSPASELATLPGVKRK